MCLHREANVFKWLVGDFLIKNTVYLWAIKTWRSLFEHSVGSHGNLVRSTVVKNIHM